MSINFYNPSVTDHVKVLVRAFGDEPVILYAIRGDSKKIEVGRDEKCTLSSPSQYVYEYDPDLFDRLDKYYREHKTVHVQELWKTAKHYTCYDLVHE